jgi:hypothetical protein
MGKIYLNQDSLRIQLTVDVSIAGATLQQIKYIKPISGDTGFWSATVEDPNSGIIYYDLVGDELDEVGTWVLWAYVTFSDGRSAPGEAVNVVVHTEGE